MRTAEKLVDESNAEPGLHRRAAGVPKRTWIVIS
jgi:hypothetical protein